MERIRPVSQVGLIFHHHGSSSFTENAQALAPGPVDHQIYAVGVPIAAPYIFPSATGGTKPYTYLLSPSLPIGFSCSQQNRTITGTPNAKQAATEFTYPVTDAAGATLSPKFYLILHELTLIDSFDHATIDPTLNETFDWFSVLPTKGTSAYTYDIVGTPLKLSPNCSFCSSKRA